MFSVAGSSQKDLSLLNSCVCNTQEGHGFTSNVTGCGQIKSHIRNMGKRLQHWRELQCFSRVCLSLLLLPSRGIGTVLDKRQQKESDSDPPSTGGVKESNFKPLAQERQRGQHLFLGGQELLERCSLIHFWLTSL